MKCKRAGRMTWQEVREEFAAGIPLVIPIGAGCKEHGLHLPNNTDQIQADYFAERLAEECDILVMPTITYNYFPAFTDYAGSVSMPIDHCVQLFVQLCEQWHAQGARGFYFLNMGVSTNVPLAAAKAILEKQNIAMQYTDHSDFTNTLMQLPKGLRPEQEGGSHADEVETSIMLAISPNVVDMSKAQKDFDPKPGSFLPYQPEPGTRGCYSPTGTWGDPSLASVAKGLAYVAEMKAYLLRDIEELVNASH